LANLARQAEHVTRLAFLGGQIGVTFLGRAGIGLAARCGFHGILMPRWGIGRRPPRLRLGGVIASPDVIQ
jgi:hypothetical protein